MVNQIKREYTAKEETMKKYLNTAQKLIANIDDFSTQSHFQTVTFASTGDMIQIRRFTLTYLVLNGKTSEATLLPTSNTQPS